jgi:hypothetical protein
VLEVQPQRRGGLRLVLDDEDAGGGAPVQAVELTRPR